MERRIEALPAPVGLAQHGAAEIDADDVGTGRIKRNIAAGTDPGIEYASAQTGEHLRAHPALVQGLAEKVENVVIGRNALVEVTPVSHRRNRGMSWRFDSYQCFLPSPG